MICLLHLNIFALMQLLTAFDQSLRMQSISIFHIGYLHIGHLLDFSPLCVFKWAFENAAKYFNISPDIFTFWAAIFHLYPKIMICCVSYWKCMKYKSWVFLLSFQPHNNTSNISEYIMYHYLPQRNSDSPKPMDFQKSFSGSPTPATLGTSFSISI